MKKYLSALTLLSLAGILVTAYLVYQHYKDPGGSFCNVNDYVSCDIVNKSVYSEFLGIPVAILGLIGYIVLFAGTLAMRKGKLSFGFVRHGTFLAGAGALFSLYLTFIEIFILRAVCIFCLTQQILIVLIFITLLTLWIKELKRLR